MHEELSDADGSAESETVVVINGSDGIGVARDLHSVGPGLAQSSGGQLQHSPGFWRQIRSSKIKWTWTLSKVENFGRGTMAALLVRSTGVVSTADFRSRTRVIRDVIVSSISGFGGETAEYRCVTGSETPARLPARDTRRKSTLGLVQPVASRTTISPS